MENCKLCSFNNPKPSVTAIIVRDGKMLMLRRNEEPFKGMWDLPGGYLHGIETHEQALKRELLEELGIVELKGFEYITQIAGTSTFEEKTIPIISSFYLVNIGDDEIVLNEENSEYHFVPIRDIKIDEVAFDSNQQALKEIIPKIGFDLVRIRELTLQLDESAEVKEWSLYVAALRGRVATIQETDGGHQKLVGIGWYFTRQTMLRKQAVVEDMIVDIEYRGRGLGRMLMEELISRAKKDGVEVMELTTNPKREAANILYQNVGFKIHPTNHYLLKL